MWKKYLFSKTIEQKMAQSRHSTGFDYLRLVFAILIIARHTLLICEGRAAETLTWIGPLRPYYQFLVPVFFALSGFLVAGSLARTNNLPTFLTLRVLRIFPALGGEVLISALIIGPLLTAWPLGAYFSSPMFFKYFENLFGNIHYFLPGLFWHNKSSFVNNQLWTVPYDLECYAIISLLAFVGIVRHPKWFGVAALLFTIGGFCDDWFSGELILDSPSPGHMVSATFLWGVFIYLCRDKIPYHPLLFCLALAVTWPLLMYIETVYVAALPIAYVTIYVGLMNPRKIFLIDRRDYSYAMYLYGFPVQQTVYQLFPNCRVWYLHFPLSLFFTSICAYLSWTFLESRIMNQKKHAVAYMNAFGEKLKRISAPTPLLDASA